MDNPEELTAFGKGRKQDKTITTTQKTKVD